MVKHVEEKIISSSHSITMFMQYYILHTLLGDL